jgi:hypothetical protein
MRKIIGFILLVSIGSAQAFETDQLTWRNHTVPDSGAVIDGYIGKMLEAARADVERKAKPEWSDERAADEFRAAVSKRQPFNLHFFGASIEVWLRTTLAQEGYVILPMYDGRKTSIYSEFPHEYRTMARLGMTWSPVTFGMADTFAGGTVSPTVMVNGVRFGGDKLSHFFRLGYRYYKKSAHGRDERAAVRYGTRTELGGLGLLTMGVFSFGDLAANHAGYTFYRDLVGRHYALERDASGRPRFRPLEAFHIGDYATEDWDEFLNPSHYTPALEDAVRIHLNKYRDRVCAERAAWAPGSDAPRAPLAPKDRYVDPSLQPEQHDPFHLEALCAGGLK